MKSSLSTEGHASAPPQDKATSTIRPLLQIRGLSVALPEGGDRAFAVQDVSLEVQAGQTVCVVGESGSGKSVMANAVMRLLPSRTLRIVGGIRVAGVLMRVQVSERRPAPSGLTGAPRRASAAWRRRVNGSVAEQGVSARAGPGQAPRLPRCLRGAGRHDEGQLPTLTDGRPARARRRHGARHDEPLAGRAGRCWRSTGSWG